MFGFVWHILTCIKYPCMVFVCRMLFLHHSIFLEGKYIVLQHMVVRFIDPVGVVLKVDFEMALVEILRSLRVVWLK